MGAINTIQTPTGKTIYLPAENQCVEPIKKINDKSCRVENSVNIARLLHSTDDVDLLSCRNTLNTSLNDIFMMLLYGAGKGARLSCCEDIPKENMWALKFLMRKKMNAINEFHGPDVYLQFDPARVYSIRKKEDSSLYRLTDDILPIHFEKDGLYLVPTYSSNIKSLDSVIEINCRAIF